MPNVKINDSKVLHLSHCSLSDYIDIVARIVYGEARGEPYDGQLAVAYTVVNRVNHQGYPNSLPDVAYQTTTDGRHQYSTLDLQSHNETYKSAKRNEDQEYKNAINAATGALCGNQTDPTLGKCAVNFCAEDPCASLTGNQWWKATYKNKIGNHTFVCMESRAVP